MTVLADFALEAGQRLAIFGTSGAGKTTILESIAGLTRLSRGTVRVDGRLVAGKAKGESPLAPRDRQVALVRQPTTLFPHLTVEQNVAYGIRRSPARPVSRSGPGPPRSPRAAPPRGRGLPPSPAASASVSRSVGPSPARSACCCSTSRCRPSTSPPVRAPRPRRRNGDGPRRGRHPRDPRPHRGAGLRRPARHHRRAAGCCSSAGRTTWCSRRRVAVSLSWSATAASSRSPRAPSRWFAIHPDRIVLGAVPERGVVLDRDGPCRRARSGLATNAPSQTPPARNSRSTSTSRRTTVSSAPSPRSIHRSWQPETMIAR